NPERAKWVAPTIDEPLLRFCAPLPWPAAARDRCLAALLLRIGRTRRSPLINLPGLSLKPSGPRRPAHASDRRDLARTRIRPHRAMCGPGTMLQACGGTHIAGADRPRVRTAASERH